MDYQLSASAGLVSMSYESSESILNDMILSVTIKAKSIAQKDGKSVYPGDWWFRPDFGQNVYEIASTTDTDVLLAETYYKKALKWLLDTKRATKIDVKTVRDSNQKNRFNTSFSAVQSDGLTVDYTTFFEVN